MNEDDTFKVLRGLTDEEALQMHTNVYCEIYEECKADPRFEDIGIPIGVIKERLDPLLRPYGWSFDRLLQLLIDKNDFS